MKISVGFASLVAIMGLAYGVVSTNITNQTVNIEDVIGKRCRFDKHFGCDKGQCFRGCGDPNKGTWCWTASRFGHGPWDKCKTDNDCRDVLFCSIGNCKKCGCSC